MNRKQKRANKKNHQQKNNTMNKPQDRATIIDCSQTFILEYQIPKDILTNLQAYSRDLIDDDKKISVADRLVGEINSGEELKVNQTDSKVIEIVEKTRSLAVSYLSEYSRKTQDTTRKTIDFSKGINVSSESMWVNYYKKGDYNPFHDHMTESPMGISWFLYIKVPENMINSKNKSRDGCTQLHFGYDYKNRRAQLQSLVIPPLMTIEPKEGFLYMFPSWLKHQVYPHSCDGERISMAGNISIFL